jgi:hypothetical protein
MQMGPPGLVCATRNVGVPTPLPAVTVDGASGKSPSLLVASPRRQSLGMRGQRLGWRPGQASPFATPGCLRTSAGEASPLPSYLTFVENERLTSDPWILKVIEPLNCLPCAAAGICQVQDDAPLLELE